MSGQTDDKRELYRIGTLPHPNVCCFGCGTPYCGDHWIEAVVSDADWSQISPTGTHGGLLCIGCMAKAFANLGRTDVPVKLTAGPFVLSNTPAQGEAVALADELAIQAASPAFAANPDAAYNRLGRTVAANIDAIITALQAPAPVDMGVLRALEVAKREIRSLGCDPDDIDLAIARVNRAALTPAPKPCTICKATTAAECANPDHCDGPGQRG